MYLHFTQRVGTEAKLACQLLRALLELGNGLGLGLAFGAAAGLGREAKLHLADGQALHLGCGGGNAGKVTPLQHQFGTALPAGDLPGLAVAWKQAKRARTHIQLPWLGLAAGLLQRAVEQLLQLRLDGGRVFALARGGQRQHQQILHGFGAGSGRQLQHIALDTARYTLSKSGSKARQQSASSYDF